MVPPENKGNAIPPILTIPHLKQYVNAKWEIFKSIISKLIKDRVDEASSNPFAQFIHDAVTMKNKKNTKLSECNLRIQNIDAITCWRYRFDQ